MAANKITIILLGDDTKKVRQLKVSKFFIGLLFLFFISASLILAWVIRDYQAIKTQIPQLSQIKKENQQQKIQLVALANRIDQIGNRLIGLKKFDHKLRVMVNLETSDENLQLLGIGGSDPSLLNPDNTVEKAHRKLVRLMHQSLDNLNTEASIQINEKAELIKFLEDQKSLLACTPSVWPVRGWISSRFGYRISPFTNEKEFHRGIDISTRLATPILATADGIVSSIGWNRGMGKRLTINHNYGLKTKFGHVSKILVKKGQYVKRGQKIALVGNTGRTTGPHLHYEVYLNGVPMNPLHYILN